MVRLFVGLELSPSQRESLTYARGGVEGAHWQRDDQLHLTLAFIGEVSHKSMREIEGELSRITFDPFDPTLTDVGMFGKFDMPKTLWAGVENKAPLMHLHEKVLTAVERTGVEMDRRRYKPHVTLARFKRGAYARIATWLSVNGVLRSPTETVRHFTLFSSHLTSEGPVYQVEAQFGNFMDGSMMSDEFALEVCA